MQIWSIRQRFKAFKCKFEIFERDLKLSNANSTHLNQIQSIRMQILTIQTKFEAFECQFEAFYQIVSIQNGFQALEAFERDSNANSNHLDQIWSIGMQIRKIRKGFEAFIYKFEPFKKDSKHLNTKSNHSKQIWSIGSIQKGFECKLWPFEPNSNHLNANSNHLKGIRSVQMQIRIIWMGFEALESKFETIERDLKHSYNINSKHSNGILNIWMQTLTIRLTIYLLDFPRLPVDGPRLRYTSHTLT